MRVKLKTGCYIGQIRELERSAALDMLRLDRVELVDKDCLTPEELRDLSIASSQVDADRKAKKARGG